MRLIENPHRGRGLSHPLLEGVPWPAPDAARVEADLARCPLHAPTPLIAVEGLGPDLRIKDERGRMGLGSFKALGAANVIARDHAAGRAAGRLYVTASAGNHGLSVAAGAAAFGARARVHVAETVPEAFAARLRALGAEVVRSGATYEEGMAAAARDAEVSGGALLSDSSWPGYVRPPHVLMEGYTALMAEAVRAMEAPDAIFLQAGVGGLAAACAAAARAAWGDAPRITVVEPEAAPALIASVEAGAPVTAPGPVSAMGRLDCKEPSLIALRGLARDADAFMTITEAEGHEGAARIAALGMPSTPSGAAGIAGMLAAGAKGTVLCILSEGPE